MNLDDMVLVEGNESDTPPTPNLQQGIARLVLFNK
jgi:hypothetical protein